jgi:hypothetical protein
MEPEEIDIPDDDPEAQRYLAILEEADRDQEKYNALAADANADAEAHPEDYRPTNDELFRRLLKGEL